MATLAQRQHAGQIMDLLVAHEPLIHYPPHDVRGPLDALTFGLLEQEIVDRFGKRQGIQCDCSQTVQHICRMAGLADPCGFDYSRVGFTGNMLKTLKHYSDPAAADVGALVVFGPGTGDHVCMVRKRGRDPLLFSHGQERGPFYIHLSDEKKAQKAPTTFLSIARL